MRIPPNRPSQTDALRQGRSLVARSRQRRHRSHLGASRIDYGGLSVKSHDRTGRRISWTVFVALCLLIGCIGGGRRTSSVQPLPDASVVTPAVLDVTDQQGLLNLVAKLEAEIAILKVQSGRDTYTGLTMQGEMSVMLAVLLVIVVLCQTAEAVFDRWAEYRVEMRKP